jgi:hypothetical protein
MRHFPLLAMLAAAPAFAETPVVTAATATPDGSAWRFDVTLSHPDTGWDHYADAWRIEVPDGTVLGQRDLAHPHVEEQPFTRSLSGVILPEGLAEVVIRARCNVDGWSEDSFRLRLP